MIELKKLNYQYNDLMSVIDAETMEIHHSKHHQGYVNNLNAALESVGRANETLETVVQDYNNYEERIKSTVRNNGGGVVNHNLYFGQFSPSASDISSNFQEIITKKFKTTELMIEELISSGLKRFGSGWAFLVLNKGELEIMSTPNQDNPLMLETDIFPLIAIDVWEHAYYLKYQNRRPEYLANVVKLINWKTIEDRYEMALKKDISYIN